jgi:hypothetical protein
MSGVALAAPTHHFLDQVRIVATCSAGWEEAASVLATKGMQVIADASGSAVPGLVAEADRHPDPGALDRRPRT